MNISDKSSNESIFSVESKNNNRKIMSLRAESQASHINRIRYAIEKRNKTQLNRYAYSLPNSPFNRSSSFATRKKNAEHSKNQAGKPEQNDVIVKHRVMTLNVSKVVYSSK
ncbi:hypothetical protein CEXT_303591 [Caerostris extrusa]|uniref:Uncharacterized protein n=1 Tax=Caerostris extrusa TaxID=172846 RepID=A0AAV4RWR0_CAEEX|nr:hypothetical protein CEXT_303591 [Caerostris extrusa]